MAIDVANAAKSVAAAHNAKVEVHGFFICNCFASNNSSPLLAANTYSLLTELNHATAFGNETAGEQAAKMKVFESQEAPFDCVYWVPTRARTTNAHSLDALDAIANYLSLERAADARAALRSCREADTPREQSRGRSLTLKKLGCASLADQKRKFIIELAAELADAVKQHWIREDYSADWERLVSNEQKSASTPKLRAATDAGAAPVVEPINDATPLALRGRFNEYMALEFTSEVLGQIQIQLESRDDRGRPLILPRDAKLIADTAREVIAALVVSVKHESNGSARFADSAVLRPLIAAGSRRVIGHAVKKFDLRQPERFLPTDAIDELIQTECRALLEESCDQPELAAAITACIELDQASAAMIECANSELLQCGCERRTLLIVPKEDAQGPAVEKLRTARPLAAVIPADIDDVLVVSEDSGISPRSLAIGLEHVFPGIADAARRLLTRVDVEWRNLI